MMNRILIRPLAGLTGYALSQLVAQLEAVDGVDKAVLRALADHYPNIWPDVDPTLGTESGWSARTVRESMRRLEASNWINGVRPLEDRLGGQGQSEQYVINDRKIIDAHAIQRLVWIKNPEPTAGFVKITRQQPPHNPASGARTRQQPPQNPEPTAGEPTIEPTKEPTTNQPPDNWLDGLQELHGQSGVELSSGLSGKNTAAILARIEADGWPQVSKSFELCLGERQWDGLTKSNVAHWYLKEYPQWIARAKSELAEPQTDVAAIKAQIDAQRNDLIEILAAKQEAEAYALAHSDDWF
jgi:hypothetical protein